MVEHCRTYRNENGSISHELMSEAEFERRHHPYKQDNHIRVTLDFIPVEERLPEKDHDVLVRREHLPSGNYTVMQATYCNPGVWEDISAMECTNSDYVVTHWGEIPNVEAAK